MLLLLLLCRRGAFLTDSVFLEFTLASVEEGVEILAASSGGLPDNLEWNQTQFDSTWG